MRSLSFNETENVSAGFYAEVEIATLVLFLGVTWVLSSFSVQPWQIAFNYFASLS